MSLVFLFFLMLFCHIFDDYYLQGWLASAKQQKWWKDNAPQSLYKYDYIAALIVHSLSWSFSIMLPLAIYNKFNCGVLYIILFIINTIIHALVDNLKANLLKINLCVDQSIHFIQIVATFIIGVIFL